MMGKAKLGQRARLFKTLFGKDFEVGNLLIVAIDAAKTQPKFQVFNYFTEPLCNSFFFTPDEIGVGYLLETVGEVMAKTNSKNVIYGIESTGHYHEPILALLRIRDCRIFMINPVTTREERRSMLDYSKTDDIDLYAIASAIAAGKVMFHKPPSFDEKELRFLTRTRRGLVKERSRYYVMLHTLLDQYWPYIQGVPEVIEAKPEVQAIFGDSWSKIALDFLFHVNTPGQALALGEASLQELSKTKKMSLGKRRIQLILKSASLAPQIDERLTRMYVENLQNLLNSIARLSEQIEFMEHRSEEIIAGTSGVLLLSVPQIGVVTVAELMAEIGLKITQFGSVAALIKMAGTNPVPDESGKHRGKMKISKQGNKYFRVLVYLIGKNLIQGRGNAYFKVFAERLKGKNAKAIRIAVGNKFIRVAYAMLTQQKLFNPPGWGGPALMMNPLTKINWLQ
jgi:transposase